MVSPAMSMLRVLWVMCRLLVPLVMPMVKVLRCTGGWCRLRCQW